MAWIRDFTVTEVTATSTNPEAQVEFPTHATDDVLLLYLAVDGVNVPALPTGYTAIQDTAGVAQAQRLCYKLATSGAEVCPTLSLSAAATWHIHVIAIAGASTGTPINTSAERTATDAAAPFTWTASASTSSADCLIFQFICSDVGLALTCTTIGYTNLINGDAGTNGGSCAYKFQPASGAITDATWTARANDDTVACLVAINDDGNGTRPHYADPLTSGSYISALGGTSLIESDTNPASLTFGAIGMRDFTQMWMDNAGAFTDETTDINDVGTADVTITNTVANAWYFGYDYKFNHMVLQISTASAGGTIVWEYWNGSAWTTLTMAGVLTATGWAKFSWTTPASMAATTVNSVSKFYVRMRISVVFTTAPILSRGHVGGLLTSFDAIGNAADTGVNPYMDAISLTPTSTTTFTGGERQFGTAKDMDTGVLIYHHKSVLPRDYAVDVAITTETYPITQIGQESKSGAINGYGGVILGLADANSNYEIYTTHTKQAAQAGNNDAAAYNVSAIGINNSAQKYGQIGTLNKSSVTRAMFLNQSPFGAMQSHISSMLMVSSVVFAGGDSANPYDIADIRRVANNSIGTSLMLQGVGDFTRIWAPIQFGGGGQINTLVDGAIFQFPTAFDGKENVGWNAADNVAGVQFFGQSTDTLRFPNCTFKGSQPFRWEFNSSHSASATIDFTGVTVQGATVTLRATSDLTGVKFSTCPTFTQNGAALTNCEFINTKVSSATPADVALIADSSFTKTTGTQHGIEISGTAADMTLDGVTFTGYAGTNGSTGNEAIYVNIASGTMVISIVGGGSTPSIRTAGATVTVQNAVTVKVTAKDADTATAIQSARVLLQASSGTTVTITRSGSTATVTHTAHGKLNGDKVVISGANESQYNILATIGNVTTNTYDYTVSGTPATPATGTITSFRVILDGATDASGIVQTTAFNYVSDLAVTGRVRKGSAATFYKTSPLSGTIGSTGLDITAFLVKDT